MNSLMNNINNNKSKQFLQNNNKFHQQFKITSCNCNNLKNNNYQYNNKIMLPVVSLLLLPLLRNFTIIMLKYYLNY